MTTVHVNASTSYDVLIGRGLLTSVGGMILPLIKGKKLALVTDSTVDGIYADTVADSLTDAGFEVSKFVFPAGEGSKCMSTYAALLNFLAEHRLSRKDAIVALGGGVTGDLAGFAAATYLRGIDFVQIPTTLLAAVDSSVGGKTAVNLKAGKNLMGAFYQPSLVLCDTDTLSTLPEEEFANGMAEIIKYGVIFDKDLFDKVSGGVVKSDMEDIIARCVELKRDVVAKDEFDRGERQLLNFGHTMAHSIEKCSNFEIPHGSAVAIGMVIASRAAFALGWSKEDCTDAIINANKNNNLPFECEYTPKDLADAALSDKKREGGTINFVMPEVMGKCVLKKIPVETLYKIAEYK